MLMILILSVGEYSCVSVYLFTCLFGLANVYIG